MIVITGGAGFIGSCLIAGLNARGIKDILVVDSLDESDKWKNLVGKSFLDYTDKTVFLEKIGSGQFQSLGDIQAVFHMGACSTTTENNLSYLIENNTLYTRELALFCIRHQIPFYYASSAATYGNGKDGFEDDENKLDALSPQNAYGFSKYLFDLWAHRHGWLKQITGFKFFNVFGPNEGHKTGMTSIVYNAFHQIQKTGSMRLFRSDHPDFRDGEQQRDFIYVKDVVNIILWFLDHPQYKGLYNLGRGTPETWNRMTQCVFKAMGVPPNIIYIEMPAMLKKKYQYYTCAAMEKLKKICPVSFTSSEKSVEDYVQNHLLKDMAW
ncbi:MAG: ADP-glyceromanno-heptose 6-epimerase [Candidatus Aureabacteria bacterium]|nr:ADP-glyceromanno-heptose 6-epimerase [Candidatus Auribacterota bacterium]